MNLSAALVLVSSGPGGSFWLSDATLSLADGFITGINRTDKLNPVIDTRAEGIALLVPGFVDSHCHGGGGGSFPSGDVAQARLAAGFHLHHGTTSLLASLVTAPHAELLAACEQLAPLVAEGILAGLHLEGPYLSHLRCGAQDPRWLREPDPHEISELFAAARGTIRQVTIAPELPGAIDAIHQITGLGAVAALGHTNAEAHHVDAAVAAGARVATHFGNAMPPLHHREANATASILTNPLLVCELIVDGHHLSEPMFHIATRTAGTGRWSLITDAIGATGQPDGQYVLGSQPVTVQNGEARLTNDPHAALAGSLLTMDQAVRNAITWGANPIDVFEGASLTGASTLGLPHATGRIAIGAPADIVGLNAAYEVTAVWKCGIRIS